MTKSKGFALAMWLLVAILMVSTAFAQETTAGLQGTVKDPSGAVVSGATVEVSGSSLIGTKKSTTDASGYYRFANLPPGVYNVTVTAKGFKSLKQQNLRLEVGKLPSIDLKMEVGGTEQVVEVSSAAPIVDVTTAKVQTNVTSEVIAQAPKGRSFQSVIQMAPGARYEPLQSTTSNGRSYSGYQIDGASNSENSYLIEGQETSDVKSGQTKTNAPFEFIQEVQVKTSGFEAEYGGALGGVVNALQKRGSNNWHGSVFTYYSADMFNAGNLINSTTDDRFLRKNPLGKITGRIDNTSQIYIPKKDHYRIVEPGYEVGGSLIKDRVWIFSSLVPRLENITRTVNYHYTGAPSNVNGPRPFKYSNQTYYALNRLDARVSDKVRVFGSWQYAYQRANGASSAGLNLPTADDAFGLYNSSTANAPDTYNSGVGYVAPNYIWNFGGDVTITPNLVATSRFGFVHSDLEDRGLPIGVRYRWLDSNYNYPGASSLNATSLQGTLLSAVPNAASLGLLQAAAISSMGPNTAQLFDKTDRLSFAQDAAWFKKGWAGTHNFKVGYALNRLQNDVLSNQNTSQVYLAYGLPYSVLPSNQGVCAQIRAQNIANYGVAGSADDTSCQGLWGTYNVREVSTVGKVSSLNHSLYVQDAWTVGHGLTVNAGVRMDKEALPSFAQGFQGVNFGFGDKVAPRLGASWDVLQNGKMKIYGSFGYFFDIMKYELTRGSFGGDYWHDCVYTLDDPNFNNIVPAIVGGHFCPTSGGANGVTTGRLIENQDYRQPSNDPSNYLVDKNLKPMKQHELVAGSDFALNSTMGIEVRYTRKRLDRTIEDSGILTPNGEQFYIVNPGEGINATVDGCPTCPANIKPTRNYDAVEFRFTRKATEKWFAQLSYTYSRLWGNYSGLTSTDVSDGGGGRSDPNVSRAFDEPWMQYTASGKSASGLLQTDRPHTFKGFAGYRIKWFGQETVLGLAQQIYSGTPLSSYLSAAGAPQYLEGRGKFVNVTRDAAGVWSVSGVSERRTSAFSQTDINLVHELKVSKTNEAMRLGFEANITNLLNQHNVVSLNQNLLATGKVQPATGDLYTQLMTNWNYLTAANASGNVLNSAYGLPNLWQEGRSMRFKVKFTF